MKAYDNLLGRFSIDRSGNPFSLRRLVYEKLKGRVGFEVIERLADLSGRFPDARLNMSPHIEAKMLFNK